MLKLEGINPSRRDGGTSKETVYNDKMALLLVID